MDFSGKVEFFIIGIYRIGHYVAKALGNRLLPTAQNYRDEDYRKTRSARCQFTAVAPRVSFNAMSQ